VLGRLASALGIVRADEIGMRIAERPINGQERNAPLPDLSKVQIIDRFVVGQQDHTIDASIQKLMNDIQLFFVRGGPVGGGTIVQEGQKPVLKQAVMNAMDHMPEKRQRRNDDAHRQALAGADAVDQQVGAISQFAGGR